MHGKSRFFPSSFDASDANLVGIPQPIEYSWKSLEEALKAWKSVGVMMRLPLFWQLEVPVHRACKATGAFLFTNDVQNMPLGGAAVRTAEIDTVVTELSDAISFLRYLADSSIPVPPYWFIVRQHGDTTPIPGKLHSMSVVEETHVSPGVVERCS